MKNITARGRCHADLPAVSVQALVLAVALAVTAALMAGCAADGQVSPLNTLPSDTSSSSPRSTPATTRGSPSNAVPSDASSPVVTWLGEDGSFEKVFPAEHFFGDFYFDGSRYEVEMNPVFYSLRRVRHFDEDLSSPYALEFRAADGKPLRQVPLSVREFWNDDGTKDGYFHAVVREPPDYASYAVLYNDETLIAVERSPNPPVAEITGIAEGQFFAHEDMIALKLNLADPDGDALTYRLYYGDNISGYESLGSARTNPEVSLRAFDLKGSDQAHFGVSVSDGTRSVFVKSPEFQVQHHSPRVRIINVSDAGISFRGYVQALFQAQIDDRDGFPEYGSSVIWESDIDGVIEPIRVSGSFTNPEIWVETADLTEGQHTLTVTATDPAGLTSTHSVPIHILHESYTPPPPPPKFQAQDDYVETQVGATIDIHVADNDTTELGSDYIKVNSDPELGTAQAVQLDSGFYDIRYTAHTAGADTFTYGICTGDHDCRTATVYVTVLPAE